MSAFSARPGCVLLFLVSFSSPAGGRCEPASLAQGPRLVAAGVEACASEAVS